MMTSLIFIIVALSLLAIAAIIYSQYKKLIETGLEAEAVIFDMQNSKSFDMRFSYPIVRFLSNEKEWITEVAKIGLPGFYKKGKIVTVIYNPNNPTQFAIKSETNRIVPIFLGGFSFIIFAIGLVKLFSIEF